MEGAICYMHESSKELSYNRLCVVNSAKNCNFTKNPFSSYHPSMCIYIHVTQNLNLKTATLNYNMLQIPGYSYGNERMEELLKLTDSPLVCRVGVAGIGFV